MWTFLQVEAVRLPLVDRFYKAQNAKVKCGRNDRVFALQDDEGALVAALRIQAYPGGDYWLRNMMIDRDWRGRGLGRALTDGVKAALPDGDIYCYSLIEVTEFYYKQGFRRVNQTRTAADVWEHFYRYKASGRDWVLMKFSPN